jgi:iron complex transport system substrate-binding protein
MSPSGNGHREALHFTQPPRQVVSLVPSLTESLFDLGFGDSVVAITDYCAHPAERLVGLPRIGGPKNPDVKQIIALQPDLILANQEENTPSAIRSLEEAGLKVWVTFPKTVRQAVDILWVLAGIYHSSTAAVRIETLEVTLDWTESALASRQTWRYFCPIWRQAEEEVQPEWWMTFNRQTYSHDVLRVVGGENIFAERQRRYPLAADLGLAPADDPVTGDTRYPRVTCQEVLEGNPQVILLPSEPFGFGESDRQRCLEAFAETDAGRAQRVILLDGSYITWHGTRLARALSELPALLDEI